MTDQRGGQRQQSPGWRIWLVCGSVLSAVVGGVLGAHANPAFVPALAQAAQQPGSADGPVQLAPAGDDGTAGAAAGTAAGTQAVFTDAAPNLVRVRVAIAFAMAQIGLPYVWGGDGPANGERGFDCSGLTTESYKEAGVPLPRTAHTQFWAGPHVPSDAPLQPGDLVFYGVPSDVHHVGLYLGDGRMVNAPRRGKPVQVAHSRWSGDDYLGATRPTALPGSMRPGIVPAPPAQPPGAPVDKPPADEEFRAPPADLTPAIVAANPPLPAAAAAAPAPLPAPLVEGAPAPPAAELPTSPVSPPAEVPPPSQAPPTQAPPSQVPPSQAPPPSPAPPPQSQPPPPPPPSSPPPPTSPPAQTTTSPPAAATQAGPAGGAVAPTSGAGAPPAGTAAPLVSVNGRLVVP